MDDTGFFSGICKKYFSYSGRLNRKPFLQRSLLVTLLTPLLAAVLIFVFAGGLRPEEYLHRDLLWLHVTLHSLLMILAIAAGFSLGVRRCHDLDKSGFWLLLGFVPCINFFWTLYLLCKRGTIGPNQYGEDPVRNDYDRMEDIADDLRKQHGNHTY